MPSLSRQDERSSSASTLFSSTMAFLNLEYGCHRTNDSENFKQSRVHLSGHQLFHKMGGSHFVQKHHSSSGSLVSKTQHYLLLQHARRAYYINNGANLNGKMIQQLYKKFKIEHRNLVPYCPQMNGAVEAANKNIKKILVNITDTYKDWQEYLPFALFAYCTSVRTSTSATSYSLVYGTEAVLPVEVEILSLKILSQTDL